MTEALTVREKAADEFSASGDVPSRWYKYGTASSPGSGVDFSREPCLWTFSANVRKIRRFGTGWGEASTTRAHPIHRKGEFENA